MKSTRRSFVIQSVAGIGALAAANAALAADAVKDADSNAVALGYHADGTKTDKAKYPKYAAGQDCGNCALYQGKAGAASGPCPLFAGKEVSSKGWCSAYNKKA